MENELWIARDKSVNGENAGDLVIYGKRPERVADWGVFRPQEMPYEDMMFFECCDCTDAICVNSKFFPEITWENSPQRIVLSDLIDLK